MKVIILAGGLPSTLIEEDEKMPKPMAEVGGHPLLWHIMKQYSYYGCNEFIICTGYKGEIIKNYFMNFYIYQSDITVDLQTNKIEVHRKQTEDWKVSIVDTGLQSSVLERLIMAHDFVGDEPVIVTYGDCLSNINVNKMLEEHQRNKPLATIAVAHPTGRNEILSLNKEGIYQETSCIDKQENAWVNACNMILEPRAFSYLNENIKSGAFLPFVDCLAEHESVQTYRHEGFWTPVETIRDKTYMEILWKEQRAPWKIWED